MIRNLLLFSALGWVIFSCSSPLQNPTQALGSVNLSVSDGRSVLPADNDIASYQASGSGPSGAATSVQTSTSGSFSFSNLAIGSWTFTVNGLDSAGVVVATGSTEVTITSGASPSATVALALVTGTGSLSLSVTWPATKTITAVTGTLTPAGAGASSTLTFTISGTMATYSTTDLATGSYLLTLQAKNGGSVVCSSPMETVLIANGKTSTWSATITSDQFVSTGKAITAFSFASPTATGTISGTNIAVTVPYGTVVTGLVASFTTTGASVTVGSTTQTSGTTANTFASPVEYLVTAADGTTQTYTVTVTVLGSSGLTVTTPSTITVTLSGNASILVSGSTMTVTATPSASVDSYAWYLDGSVLSGQTTSSVTVGSGLVLGPHSLMALVRKNGVLFSSQCSFTVSPGYQVTFDANGGSGTMDRQDVAVSAVGTATLNPNTFTNTGYSFAGWTTSTSAVGTNYADQAVFDTAGSVTLYAVWLPTALSFTSSVHTITVTDCDTSYSGSLTIPYGVTALAASAFANCSSLTAVTLPQGIAQIPTRCFISSGLTSLTIPEGVTTIGEGAFSGMTALKTLTLPSTTTSIGSTILYYTSWITSVSIKATTPPTINSDAFSGANTAAIFYVPRASLATYQAATGWSDYSSQIVAYDF